VSVIEAINVMLLNVDLGRYSKLLFYFFSKKLLRLLLISLKIRLMIPATL
jgi:hypothetical protein